jgi:mitogen-activated protein kinase kinase kinase
MSLSTEDGRSVDLHSEDEDSGPSGPDGPQLLPPIPLEDSSFSESMEEITASRPVSRAKSTKRLSFMSELRSQRDVSDTASLMTVDEVTAEIENRRASKMRDPDLEEWTKVDTEPTVPADEGEDESTLATEDDLEDDLDDDDLSDDEFDLEIPTRSGGTLTSSPSRLMC